MVTNLGMYYPNLLPLVWFGYLMGGLAVAWKLYLDRGVPVSIVPFLSMTALFVLYSYISVLWAYNPEYCMESDGRLLRSVLMAWIICMLVKTRWQWHMAMLMIAIAGVVDGLFYLQYVDLTKLAAARFNSQLASNIGGLPHLNIVAMYMAFAGVFFMSELSDKRHKPVWARTALIILLVVTIVIVFMFGSRKSILTVAAGVFLYIMVASSGMRKIQMACLVAIAVCLLLALLPPEYIEFVIKRLFGTFDSERHLAPEDRFRLRMIQNAGEYITSAPLFGHGFYNFAELFGRDTGAYLYAHNNMIECMTGGGIVGFVLYYSLFYIIIRNWWLTRKTNPSSMTVAVFMVLIIMNGFLIVYLTEQFIWCLLALMYIGSRGFRSDAEETDILRGKRAVKQFRSRKHVKEIEEMRL